MDRDMYAQNAYQSQAWSRLVWKICVSRNIQNQDCQSWRGGIMAGQKSKRVSWSQETEHTHVNLHNPKLMENAGAKKTCLKTASLYEPVSTLFFCN